MGLGLAPLKNLSPQDIVLQLFLAVITHETTILALLFIYYSSILSDVFLNKKPCLERHY